MLNWAQASIWNNYCLDHWCIYGSTDLSELNHCGLMMKCVREHVINCLGNGVLPVWCQAIPWTNDGLLPIRPLGKDCILIKIFMSSYYFSEYHLRFSSNSKYQNACSGKFIKSCCQQGSYHLVQGSSELIPGDICKGCNVNIESVWRVLWQLHWTKTGGLPTVTGWRWGDSLQQ